MKVPEVAKHFGVSNTTVFRWIASGHLGSMRHLCGCYWITQAHIDAFTANRKALADFDATKKAERESLALHSAKP